MAADGLGAYFGVKREHMRWLTGFPLADGEEKVAGSLRELLVGPEDVVLVTDPRYTIQARREAPGAGVDAIAYDLPARGAAGGSVGCPARGRGGRPACHTRSGRGWPRRRRTWSWSPSTAGWRRIARPKEPRRDRADRGGMRGRGPGARGVAAGDPAGCHGARPSPCASSGSCARAAPRRSRSTSPASPAPEAALPHGSPGDRPVRSGAVLLFDFGAQVAGYRSDMTRTLFVGEPTARDLAVYDVVPRLTAGVDRRVGGARRDGGRARTDGTRADPLARR